MNTRHESFLSRYGSPRELKWLVLIDTALTQQVSSRVALTYAILNIAKQNSDSKTVKAQLITEISHTDRKDRYGSKIYIKQPRCLNWNKGYYILKALLQTTTNIREGFTNDPRTHHY